MDKGLDLKYNNSDFDITKYILIILKRFKLLIIATLISILLNFLFQSYKNNTIISEIDVSERDTIQFYLPPSTFRTLNEMGFTTEVLYKMQLNNFLNYDSFLNSYNQLDSKITKDYPAKDIFDSLDYKNNKIEEKINSGKYFLSSNLEPIDNALILGNLVVNAENKTYNDLILHLKQKKIDLIQDIEDLKNRLIYEVKINSDLKKYELQENIDLLKDNLAVAEFMGYSEPVLNIFNESEYVIQIAEEEGSESAENIQSQMSQMTDDKNLYFLGSKILSKQIDQMTIKLNELNKKEIGNSSDLDTLIVMSKDFSILVKENLKKTNFLKKIKNAIYEIENLKSKDKKTSILTNYNLDRISSKNDSISIVQSYIFAILTGIALAIIYVVLNHNIKTRLRDDDQLAIDTSIK